jgi:glucose-6-phosphate isomerase
LAVNYDKKELEAIIKEADYVRKNYDVSSSAASADPIWAPGRRSKPSMASCPNQKLEIIWLGQTFDPTYLAQHLDYLKDKKFAVNVISKSGTTTETSVSVPFAQGNA